MTIREHHSNISEKPIVVDLSVQMKCYQLYEGLKASRYFICDVHNTRIIQVVETKTVDLGRMWAGVHKLGE